MANIFVVGAHGHVGKLIVSKLSRQKNQVYAGFRDPNQFTTVANLAHVTPVQFDLTASPASMASLFQIYQIDTLVFSAGSGGQTGDDLTLLIDLDGAVKTIDAAQKAGIKRYVMISAAGADERDFWPQSGLHPYYVAKHYADRFLKESALEYTIIRPTALTNGAGSGKVAVNPTQLSGSISRDDVASAVVAVLADSKTSGHIYQITSGDDPISGAF